MLSGNLGYVHLWIPITTPRNNGSDSIIVQCNAFDDD
jgi:hypothetical protein